jgi:GT2 family glycosyltransferase
MKARGLSIVIPNFNSSRYLAKLLETYTKYRSTIEPVEILVVDDSNSDEAEASRVLCERHEAKYLWCKGNVAKKRNFGFENSQFEIVFFTDSDCQLESNTLEEHLKLFDTDDTIGAMYGVVEFSGETNWVWKVVERTGFLGAYSFAKLMPFAPYAGAGNLSIKRKVFEEITGFDETFLKAPGGEDVDLSIRINKSGYKIKCNPDAIIYHTKDTWNSFRRMHRRVFNYGRAHYHVISKHMDKVGREFPRIATMFIITFILLILKSIIITSVIPLFSILLFTMTVMCVQGIWVLKKNNISLTQLPKEIVAHWLDMTFEWGLIYESLKNKDLKGFYAKMIYSDRQLIYERDRKIIQAWSLAAGFIVAILFQ